MMSTFGFAAPAQTPAFSGFSFGATSTSTPNLATSSNLGTNTLGTATPFGGLGGATTTTTSTLFGNKPATSTTSGFSLFSTPASTTAAFPTLGQPAASTAPTTGFSFGGFGAPAANTSLTFGTGLAPTATTTSAPVSVGLGGVDIQTSTGLNGATSAKKDGKAIKESQIPNEISVTVESFKKYVKEQKAIREEMSRVSSKNIFRVQEQVVALRQQLSVVSNGLQRNAVMITKLKEESNQELKNAEIAHRTKDAPSSLQYENNAPTEYFHNLANSFERQMQSYRQQIELLERHLLSLSQPYTLTPNEWTAIRRRLHDTFVTLAAQLQTVHQEVQVSKEHFVMGDKGRKEVPLHSHLPASPSFGPSPFAPMQSAVSKAIHNRQLPGGSTLGGIGSSTFGSGQIGVPFGSSCLSDTSGFGNNNLNQSQFALNSQKPFQLQKPPTGNKRGKRWTST